MMAGLFFLLIGVAVLSPIVVLVLQFLVMRRQREASIELEVWLPEMRRQIKETQRLIEDLGRRVTAAGMTPAIKPRPQPVARSEEPDGRCY